MNEEMSDELLREVLNYHHGNGKYNFSNLNSYDRENAAADAWIEIKRRIETHLSIKERANHGTMDV